MRTSNLIGAAALFAAALVGVTPAVADEKVRFGSPTEAYRNGVGAYRAGLHDLAVPALEFAARNGVLGAQLRLAKMYLAGDGVEQSGAKAYHFYQLIADRYAETPRQHPIAPYAAEAFVALARFHRVGIEELKVKPDPARAVGLLRHAASVFGDATAQFELAQMYLAGQGVPKNARLAVNWLASAAKKQHAPSQAVLGDLLWRGSHDLPRQPLKGLALLALARRNAAGSANAVWIEALQDRALAKAAVEQRDGATKLLARWQSRRPGATAKAQPAPATPAVPSDGLVGDAVEGRNGAGAAPR